ncbi:MAG: RagB/SusD family nutrient uptake outer membrane protein [Tannerellaceae bacterium]|nr:RagB/SusD family nutrient uptake outer membrane protein [Tannerellaceae bacterium]
MKINIKTCIGILLLTATTACSDFLQKDPPSVPSEASFWQKKSDFEAYLAASYSIMNANNAISQAIPCYDGLSDNVNVAHDEDTYGKIRTIAQGDLNSQSGGLVNSIYSSCYKGINTVHILMEKTEEYGEGILTEKEQKQIIAECKGLRGLYYSYLYLFYKEVPLFTESLNMDNMYQPKSTREAIYTQIMKDFDEAIKGLEEMGWDLPYYNSTVTGHITPSALKVLKARIMMFDAYGDNGTADKNKMKDVIPLLESITDYKLMDRTRDNFIRDLQVSSEEIMFSIRYLASTVTNSLDLWYGDWNTTGATWDLIRSFECTDGKEWGVSGETVPVDESLIFTTDGSKFDEMFAEREKLYQNRDQRLRESISHSDYIQFTEEGYNTPIKTSNPMKTGFSNIKLLQPTDIEIGYSTISDADIVLVRYTHVLLMIAEAENEVNGPTPKAYNVINKVRERSGQPELPANLTTEQFRERVRREWRVETCFEGLRYFHMKQWGLLEKINGMADPGESGYIKNTCRHLNSYHCRREKLINPTVFLYRILLIRKLFSI